MPNLVVDIEWPLAGTEVSKAFTASVKVSNEDDVPLPPSDMYFVKCRLTKGIYAYERVSDNFAASTEPLLAFDMQAEDKSQHSLVAELYNASDPATVVASDEEVSIKVLETGGATVRPLEPVIELIEDLP